MSNLEIQAREILRLRALVNEILARHTGQPVGKVARDTDRDFILDAGQALEYGWSTRSSPTARSSRWPAR
jgi:ATP-dependent Clp protease, protease subunit